jgi:hypothetical protein
VILELARPGPDSMVIVQNSTTQPTAIRRLAMAHGLRRRVTEAVCFPVVLSDAPDIHAHLEDPV